MKADAVPGVKFKGHVERISSATGSAFSLLPIDVWLYSIHGQLYAKHDERGYKADLRYCHLDKRHHDALVHGTGHSCRKNQYTQSTDVAGLRYWISCTTDWQKEKLVIYREFDINGLNDSIFISKNLFRQWKSWQNRFLLISVYSNNSFRLRNLRKKEKD